MTRRRHAAAAAFVLLISSSSFVLAQTPLGSKGQTQVPTRTIGQQAPVATTPPGKSSPASAPAAATAQPSRPQQPQGGQQQAGQPGKIPMSAANYTQALEQSEGLYTEMQRPGPGGQIQEAWDKVEADPATGQKRQGVYAIRLCEDCIYKVRTREMMTTTIILPEDAVIAVPPDLGDPEGFKAKVKTANTIAIRPDLYGTDTNLTVQTKSGRIYAFYLRSEGFNSLTVPDLVVKIVGREKSEPVQGLPEQAAAAGTSQRQEKAAASKLDAKTAAAVRDLTSPAPPSGDFVRNVPFDPAKLHGWKEYSLKGDSELKPEMVYRDDFFTYIRYGKKWDGMELGTAYVTVDGIDELINTRVQGSTYIVESVAPLITLKDGKKYLCIRYTGDQP
ncbi:MAG: TrbG/VirB9 family P-type conjugative transfer protein [Rhodospirillaceae bacterium]|nr:TrbG/VirB9 family P-type conjugative transfer protein [Rhodospirillales bacterium]